MGTRQKMKSYKNPIDFRHVLCHEMHKEDKEGTFKKSIKGRNKKECAKKIKPMQLEFPFINDFI
jgi:hypothetical protein